MTDLVYLNDCLRVCAMYNFALNSTAGSAGAPPWAYLCSGVVYKGGDGNATLCTLQSGMTLNATDVKTDFPVTDVVSAVLIWPDQYGT